METNCSSTWCCADAGKRKWCINCLCSRGGAGERIVGRGEETEVKDKETMDEEKAIGSPGDEQISEEGEQEEPEVEEEQEVQIFANTADSVDTVSIDDAGKEAQTGLQAATNLSRDSSRPGWVTYHNPNSAKIFIIVKAYWDGRKTYSSSSWISEEGDITEDLSDGINYDRDYTFQIRFLKKVRKRIGYFKREQSQK